VEADSYSANSKITPNNGKVFKKTKYELSSTSAGPIRLNKKMIITDRESELDRKIRNQNFVLSLKGVYHGYGQLLPY